jgi:phage nucleotide-binding protein
VKDVKDINRPRSWVIYGRSGTGKTTLACSFPGPALLVDVKDEGTDSVSDVKGLKVLEASHWDDLEDLYWYLKENPKTYKTVIIDTMTQVQQLVVEQIGESKGLRSGKAAGDWGTMNKQDWGEVSSRLKAWITNMRDLPLEVVFLAQDRVFNVDEEEGSDGAIEPEVGPRMSPSVMSHMCAAVSCIGNTFIREKVVKVKVNGKEVEKRKKEYCIRLGPNSYYITKLRKPKSVELPDFLTNPTYEGILDIISGDY